MSTEGDVKNKKNGKRSLYDRGIAQGIQDKTTRFLIVSLASVSILCMIVFAFFTIHMNRHNSNTISEIGRIYMSGMSEQVAMHFETTIDLRLSQLEALNETIPPERFDGEEMRQQLAYNAQVRGFEYLAFYSQDGKFEMIYGEPVSLSDPLPFYRSIAGGDKKVAVGRDTDGKELVLVGVPAKYPMSDGKECIALVAGLPIEYIQETLFLNKETSMEYYFIVRRDGSFITRSDDVEDNNYFDRVWDLYEDVGGKTPEEYLAELGTAMDARKDYSTEFTIYGERRHLYCTSLSYSEWYLLVFMPYGVLDETISQLGSEWIYTALCGCAIILIALLFVFGKYLKITWQQMEDLDEARNAAEHANQAKSEFLSNMSHDIRTPMNAIVGMTSIAIANIDNQQQVQNCLKKIALSSRHLLGLINDILDMSKIESGKMALNVEQVSLSEAIDGIVTIIQPQAREKELDFEVYIHDVFQENVCCDGVRLNQILINFLGNAVKFTPEGGNISLSLSEEESPVGESHVRVHLWVTDNGIGMSEEFQKKIFDSFSREDSTRVQRTEGTGLGMTITKYIVDAMGGTIEIHSEPGKGSKFHVILDLERAVVSEEDMRLPGWRMLVVDDDSLLCENAVSTLESIGVKAEWVLDGESAVRMAEEQYRQGQCYDIILLDWKLPGMDGIRTAREIQKICGDKVRLLLTSAYDWSEIEKEAREAGLSGFIAKPLFKSTLFYGLGQFTQEDGSLIVSKQDAEVDFNGRRILLAEDNELNWEIAEELLSQLGLELHWAENGKICVEMFENSPQGTYDGILMDIRMPVMTGYEAAQAIRALEREDAKKIPIIAMSADAFSDDIQKCLKCGMNAHIAKPVDMREAQRVLEKFILKRG